MGRLSMVFWNSSVARAEGNQDSWERGAFSFAISLFEVKTFCPII
jgi:hypothetical protein